MLLGGLWHGAAWTFVLWGLYQGLLLILYRPFEPAFAALGRAAGPAAAAKRFAAWFVMFHLTCYGWLIFRAPSFAKLREMTARPVPGLRSRHGGRERCAGTACCCTRPRCSSCTSSRRGPTTCSSCRGCRVGCAVLDLRRDAVLDPAVRQLRRIGLHLLPVLMAGFIQFPRCRLAARGGHVPAAVRGPRSPRRAARGRARLLGRRSSAQPRRSPWCSRSARCIATASSAC